MFHYLAPRTPSLQLTRTGLSCHYKWLVSLFTISPHPFEPHMEPSAAVILEECLALLQAGADCWRVCAGISPYLLLRTSPGRTVTHRRRNLVSCLPCAMTRGSVASAIRTMPPFFAFFCFLNCLTPKYEYRC